MTYRTSSSFAFFLLLTAGACAVQNAGAGFDDPPYEGDDAGGKSSGGSLSTAGTSSVHPIAGTTSASGSANKGGTSSGGSGGKTGTGGSGGTGGKTSTGGKGGTGSGGTGGAGGTSSGDGGAPTNNPVDGLTLTFTPESTDASYDFIGGKLKLTNDAAPAPLDYGSLKVRYYFTNEVATAAVIMNWANWGPTSNAMPTSCTGTVVKMPTPKPGADSYIELTCSATGSFAKGSMLEISWKAGDQGKGKFTQTGDWSYMDPDKIVVIDNNNIVWGVEP